MVDGRPDGRAAAARGLDPAKLPRHVAFIMDGNGRWARRHGFLRFRGHEEGAAALRRVTRYCRSVGIREATFFALSSENFMRRPAREVRFLLGLLKRYLVKERRELLDNNIRLRAIGHVEAFPEDVQKTLQETERLTALEDGMVMRLALNYGARQEILDAVRSLAGALAAGEMTLEQVQALTEDDFRRHLGDPDMSDPDLLVRTAGEARLSNFLLWQSSYTEIWVTPVLWPDLDEAGVREALLAYGKRVRKYGAVGPPRERARIASEDGGRGARGGRGEKAEHGASRGAPP